MVDTTGSNRKGFTLIEITFVVALISTVAAIAIPVGFRGLRLANERNASASLKSLVAAEVDFRGNDRDGNLVTDYWTGDVAGLFCMTSASTRGRNDAPIKLIEVSLAAADTSPLSAGAAGGEYQAISAFALQGPKAEYWYYAMNQDQSVSPAQTYRQNTGGLLNMGNVHHPSGFAFLAYPSSYKYSGINLFIINENGVVLKANPGRSIKSREAVPPGAPLSAWRNWPSDAVLKSTWSKMD